MASSGKNTSGNLYSTSIASSTALAADSNGVLVAATAPYTPSVFSARVNTPVTNVTGDGTNYTVIFNTAAINTGSNYDTATGIYTAPATGSYSFQYGIFFTSIGGAHTGLTLYIQGTSTWGGNPILNPAPIALAGSGNISLNGSITLALTSGNTVSIGALISGGAKTVGVYGDATTAYSYFSGFRVS